MYFVIRDAENSKSTICTADREEDTLFGNIWQCALIELPAAPRGETH